MSLESFIISYLSSLLNMSNVQTTITPHNQNPFITRIYPSEDELDKLIANAVIAQKAWSAVSVEDRITVGKKFMVVILSALCRNPRH